MTILLFDNAGGITLQTDSYAHYYNGAESQAALDVSILLKGGNTDDWDGNEQEHRIEGSFENYDAFTLPEINEKLHMYKNSYDECANWGASELIFFVELAKI